MKKQLTKIFKRELIIFAVSISIGIIIYKMFKRTDFIYIYKYYGIYVGWYISLYPYLIYISIRIIFNPRMLKNIIVFTSKIFNSYVHRYGDFKNEVYELMSECKPKDRVEFANWLLKESYNPKLISHVLKEYDRIVNPKIRIYSSTHFWLGILVGALLFFVLLSFSGLRYYTKVYSGKIFKYDRITGKSWILKGSKWYKTENDNG